jgi:Mrp family chromosome partitioning ATPase
LSVADSIGVLVTSGKGGVGKTLCSVGVTAALAQKYSVGLLDLDTRSPNLPCILGIEGLAETDPTGSPRPKYVKLGGRSVPVFSSSFVYGDGRGITMAGEQVRSMIRDEIVDVLWPDGIDWMVLDSDPAPGDSVHAARRWFKKLCAVVVTASDVSSIQDCTRMLDAFQDEQVPVVAVIGNMIGAKCASCGALMPYGDEEMVRKLATRFHVPYAGSLPWDPVYRSQPVVAVQTVGLWLFEDIAKRLGAHKWG